ncbi:hypothetical protein PENTCL1PPCAC_14826, partial [Pristionchus entomophagus]
MTYTELAPILKTVKSATVPFCGRLDRIHKITIERTEENLAIIARALTGKDVQFVTFYQVSMKHISDVARVLSGMKSN